MSRASRIYSNSWCSCSLGLRHRCSRRSRDRFPFRAVSRHSAPACDGARTRSVCASSRFVPRLEAVGSGLPPAFGTCCRRLGPVARAFSALGRLHVHLAPLQALWPCCTCICLVASVLGSLHVHLPRCKRFGLVARAFGPVASVLGLLHVHLPRCKRFGPVASVLGLRQFPPPDPPSPDASAS